MSIKEYKEELLQSFELPKYVMSVRVLQNVRTVRQNNPEIYNAILHLTDPKTALKTSYKLHITIDYAKLRKQLGVISKIDLDENVVCGDIESIIKQQIGDINITQIEILPNLFNEKRYISSGFTWFENQVDGKDIPSWCSYKSFLVKEDYFKEFKEFDTLSDRAITVTFVGNFELWDFDKASLINIYNILQIHNQDRTATLYSPPVNKNFIHIGPNLVPTYSYDIIDALLNRRF